MESVLEFPTIGGEIKSLKVFSKKLNTAIDVLADSGKLIPKVANYWMDNGWNNYSGSWLNNGWCNSGGRWMNSGWNNYSGSWMNGGWNNYSWSNGGWSNSSGGGGCYITTAAIQHAGLTDDSDELNLLRQYRDKLVEDDENFRDIVLEYYRTAPQIVEAITNSKDKDEVLDYIYNNMVILVLNLLKQDRVEEAKSIYLQTYEGLKEKYYINPNKQIVKTRQ